MKILDKIIPFAAGVLFSVGLVIGGMTQPSKVVGFLDFLGNWDPSLAFVMGGAVLTYMPLYWLAVRRSAPVFGAKFSLPTRRDLDPRLIAGAALFGAGWGLAGYCPGPGITAVGSGPLAPLTFVAAMLTGMTAFALADGPLRARLQAVTTSA